MKNHIRKENNIMNQPKYFKKIITMSASALTAAVIVFPAVIFALGITINSAASAESSPGANASTTGTAGASAAQTTRLNNIISRGNAEITRRINSLNEVSAKISNAPHLTSTNKSLLSNEVTTEIAGLTALKTKLDADTQVSTAVTDAQGIVTDYRVYALILPKIWLIRWADDQIATETKLTSLATKLQTRITAAQTAGKNVTSLTASLADMNKQISNAQTISTGIESSVINLQPTDYNTNHAALDGDSTQLKTAQTDIKTAVSDATSIVNGLKALG
jgi:hypothetical protein